MADDQSLHVEDTRAYAQGELFLLTRAGDALDAIVYNTTGFGPCPKDAFEAIDTEQLAEQTGVDVVWKNPRRWWMMDALTINLAGEPSDLGGLPFNLVAKMQMPAGFNPGQDQSAQAYRPTQIRRVTRYDFAAGRPVFLLRSPQDVTWVMQTFTDHIDSALTADGLPDLGARLDLPAGWSYRAQVLQRDLSIDTRGVANIVPDRLANMYQGCLDGVNNFDPWES
jgi:hypothetical protein